MARPFACCALALALVATVAACGGGDPGDGTSATGARPNFVVIMTDDQTVASMRVLEQTRALLADEGTTFTEANATFPLCCPARAQFLTGQYAHNNGVRDDTLPDGGYSALDHDETLPVWLQRVGYRTTFVGKYLNSYAEDSDPAIPPGWDRWFSLIGPTTTDYFDYDVNDNGQLVHRGTEAADYQTDVLADRAVDEIRTLADGDEPFFVNFWPTAPHSGTGPGALPFSPAPAPRHLDRFDDEPRPRSPAIDETDLADKPGFVSEIGDAFSLGVVQYNLENGTDLALDQMETIAHSRYLESLLAVDEAVARIVAALDDAGVLDDTVVMFFSDNGWTFGEHGIPFAKVLPYDPVLRVPLIVRGEGFARGATVDEQVGIIDLPPTVLALAGVAPGLVSDGRALPMDAPAGDSPGERVLLLESPPRGSGLIPHYDGVRSPRYTFVRYETGEVELYDREADPDELENRADDPAMADKRALLDGLLDDLLACVGSGCQGAAPPGT